ncbi:hypothetical protein CA223_17165 [Sphingomonas koreensis]|uniref:Uncharacterized protein n=1 Tax=Sphingomonas koreensis TaxID=93064 RepID=A0A1L6J9M6_9SPHN|nr:hypothetical protein BRX40_09065 [Sphingomonas koreensis]RSU18217.1 hypothetical protein CA224_16355 [Sphingomonas koreensis]RSU28623.1 hypothetical protein CA222_06165 [Sphingomonas koreensis]RSU31058.1 hypothetical protein CA225_02815 [Sphingomonas koreensis]RSU31628.1 hypothetical protein BRX39_17975 [Sphingomonas koreensis]
MPLQDSLLIQVVRFPGRLFETAGTDGINYRDNLRDAMLHAMGSSWFAIYRHIIRRRTDVELTDRSRPGSIPPGAPLSATSSTSTISSYRRPDRRPFRQH